MKQIFRVVGSLIGILIALLIGFFVIQIAVVYFAAWWTGKSPAFYWP